MIGKLVMLGNCPCGKPAITRDGASYVCASCLKAEAYFAAHDKLSDEEVHQRALRHSADQQAAILAARRGPEPKPGPLGILIRGYGTYAL